MGFGLIISAYLIRITHHDHRASPESGCVTTAITNVRSNVHLQTNPEQVPHQDRNYTFSYNYFFKSLGMVKALDGGCFALREPH